MKLERIRVVRGPSLYADGPVVVAEFDGEDSGFLPRHEDFADAVESLIAGHAGAAAGKTPRLTSPERRDPFRLILDLAASMLQRGGVAGARAYGVVREDSRIALVLGIETPGLGVAALRVAAILVNAAARGRAGDLAARAEAFVERCRHQGWSADERYFVAEARRRGVPCLDLNREVFLLGHGRHRRFYSHSMTDRTGRIGVALALNKALSLSMLRAAGVPVPLQELVHDADGALRAARRIGYPVVIKPADRGKGIGVSVGVTDDQAVSRAFALARRGSAQVLVERELPGDDHRLMVVDGTVVAAACRRPAEVLGDGHCTIAELVEQENRRRAPAIAAGRLSTIHIDDATRQLLASLGLGPDHVPAAGECVKLKTVSNISQGGLSEDVTGRVHPDNIAAAVQAARVVELDIAGVDFLCPDIGRSWREAGGGICEINPFPGMRAHYAPAVGDPVDVAGAVLAHLFPPGTPARATVWAIIDPAQGEAIGDALWCSAVASRRGVALQCGARVRIDDESFALPEPGGIPTVPGVLHDPRVGTLVAVVDADRAQSLGLEFDACDIAVIGPGGAGSVDARIAGLVTRLTKGTVILHHDTDPGLQASVAAGTRICLYSDEGPTDAVERHVAAGGCAVVRRDGGSEPGFLVQDGKRQLSLAGADLPRCDDAHGPVPGPPSARFVAVLWAAGLAGT